MISVRQNVFETNSSSTHSLCVCTEEDYEKFVRGETMYNTWSDEFLSKESYENLDDGDKYDYKAYDSMGDYLEYYEHRFTTPSGDKMVVFGEFGYDG